jgi:nucleolar GTP-binding protein
LAQRVESKLKSKANATDSLLSRIHVAVPVPRDNVVRPACIPEAVLRRRAAMALVDDDDATNPVVRSNKTKKKLEKDIEKEMGDDYILDLKSKPCV